MDQSAYDLVCARLAQRTGGTGRNGSWPCPAHDDSTPSLSVSQGRDGVVMHCHAGCATSDVIAELGLTEADLFDKAHGNGHQAERRILRVHDYVDETGRLLYQTVRFDGTGSERFRQRRPDGHGGWIWKLGDTRRVLYQLPAILDAKAHGDTILIAEGEHDADALTRAGRIATTNPLGATNWRPEFTQMLAGATIVLVLDRDPTGRKRGVTLLRDLEAAGCTIAGIYEPVEGKDAAEVLGMGYDLDTGFRAIDLGISEPDPEPPADRTTWAPVTLADVLDGDIEHGPQPELLTRSDGIALLYPGRCHALNGEPESGKTWAALLAAHQRVTVGGHVLYIDFEDDARAVLHRLLAIGARPAELLERFHYLRPDEPLSARGGKITRAAQDLQEALQAWPHSLAVIDGVTEAMILEGLSPEKNDEYATWHKLLPRALAGRGIATLQLDHVTKDRETRGRWAIGAQHKLAAIDGAAYTFDPAKPFGIGRYGIAKITVNKDRPGAIRQHADSKRIADLHLDATASAVICDLRPPDTGRDDHGQFRPTHFMDKVSRWLELNPGATGRQVRETIRGRNEVVTAALKVLVDEGRVTATSGPRNAVLYTVIRPFREDDE